MLNAIPTILTVLAFLLVVARPLAPHVVAWLDRPDLQRWAWLPPAVVLALSVLSDRLLAISGAPPALSPDVSATLSGLEALVQAFLAGAVAYQQGHAPEVKP